MLCPVCGCDKSGVYWTSKGEDVTHRRRECVECLTRFETVEQYTRVIPPELTRIHKPKKKGE